MTDFTNEVNRLLTTYEDKLRMCLMEVGITSPYITGPADDPACGMSYSGDPDGQTLWRAFRIIGEYNDIPCFKGWEHGDHERCGELNRMDLLQDCGAHDE